MTFFILDNEELFHQLSTIKNLFSSFYELIKFKSQSSEEEYTKQLEKFNKQLYQYEQFFYTKIRKKSKYYNEKTLSSIIKLEQLNPSFQQESKLPQ